MSDWTLNDARSLMRAALRDRDQDSYDGSDLDHGIRTKIHEFNTIARVLSTRASLAVAEGDPSLDASALAGFHPGRIDSIWFDADTHPTLAWKELRRGSIAAVRRDLADGAAAGSGGGEPKRYGFHTRTAGLVSPTPDKAYTLGVIYIRDHPHIIGGTSTIEIPRGLLEPALVVGVAAFLKFAERDEAAARALQAEFREMAVRARGDTTADLGVGHDADSYL